jgi:quercetin dioxygenase-like cupin family protein
VAGTRHDLAVPHLHGRVPAELAPTSAVEVARGHAGHADKPANIDLSTLSRLESGKRRLALDHIPLLAGALGVSSDELLRSPRPSDPRVRQPPRRFDGLTVWPLTNRGHGGGLRAYKVHVAARRRTPPATMEVHDGHDWLYVISGRLRLLLGEDNHLLDPGEAAEFTTWTPHWFGAVDGPADFILVVGPQGERTHLEH